MLRLRQTGTNSVGKQRYGLRPTSESRGSKRRIQAPNFLRKSHQLTGLLMPMSLHFIRGDSRWSVIPFSHQHQGEAVGEQKHLRDPFRERLEGGHVDRKGRGLLPGVTY